MRNGNYSRSIGRLRSAPAPRSFGYPSAAALPCRRVPLPRLMEFWTAGLGAFKLLAFGLEGWAGIAVAAHRDARLPARLYDPVDPRARSNPSQLPFAAPAARRRPR